MWITPRKWPKEEILASMKEYTAAWKIRREASLVCREMSCDDMGACCSNIALEKSNLIRARITIYGMQFSYIY